MWIYGLSRRSTTLKNWSLNWKRALSWEKSSKLTTVWKVAVFGVFHIPGPDSFSGPTFSGPDQKNAEYKHFFRSVRNTPKNQKWNKYLKNLLLRMCWRTLMSFVTLIKFLIVRLFVPIVCENSLYKM